MTIDKGYFYRHLIHLFEFEHRRPRDGGIREMRVTFRPPDVRFDTIWELLGKQDPPCHFEPGELLKQAIFDDAERIENAEIFNVTDEYLGLEERFVGWSFICRYEEREDCHCFV